MATPVSNYGPPSWFFAVVSPPPSCTVTLTLIDGINNRHLANTLTADTAVRNAVWIVQRHCTPPPSPSGVSEGACGTPAAPFPDVTGVLVWPATAQGSPFLTPPATTAGHSSDYVKTSLVMAGLPRTDTAASAIHWWAPAALWHAVTTPPGAHSDYTSSSVTFHSARIARFYPVLRRNGVTIPPPRMLSVTAYQCILMWFGTPRVSIRISIPRTPADALSVSHQMTVFDTGPLIVEEPDDRRVLALAVEHGFIIPFVWDGRCDGAMDVGDLDTPPPTVTGQFTIASDSHAAVPMRHHSAPKFLSDSGRHVRRLMTRMGAVTTAFSTEFYQDVLSASLAGVQPGRSVSMMVQPAFLQHLAPPRLPHCILAALPSTFWESTPLVALVALFLPPEKYVTVVVTSNGIAHIPWSYRTATPPKRYALVIMHPSGSTNSVPLHRVTANVDMDPLLSGLFELDTLTGTIESIRESCRVVMMCHPTGGRRSVGATGLTDIATLLQMYFKPWNDFIRATATRLQIQSWGFSLLLSDGGTKRDLRRFESPVFATVRPAWDAFEYATTIRTSVPVTEACCVCFDDLNTIDLYHCGNEFKRHSVHAECYRHMRSTGTGGAVVSCPMCRMRGMVPEEALSSVMAWLSEQLRSGVKRVVTNLGQSCITELDRMASVTGSLRRKGGGGDCGADRGGRVTLADIIVPIEFEEGSPVEMLCQRTDAYLLQTKSEAEVRRLVIPRVSLDCSIQARSACPAVCLVIPAVGAPSDDDDASPPSPTAVQTEGDPQDVAGDMVSTRRGVGGGGEVISDSSDDDVDGGGDGDGGSGDASDDDHQKQYSPLVL